ncbi:MAG: glycosyltransferase family 39 protein [Candidatus Hydrogenedentes bacterium]|nr:glycosyltransferase family 39 protein [Candidatus Hydrogenedentota bacterium]
MNSTLNQSGPWRDLLALVGLAAACRLLFLLAMPRVLDSADAIHYVETAARLASGDFFGYDPKIPIFYPLLGAFASLVFADMEQACRAVSLVASVLTVIPVYLLARDLHGTAPARIAGLIFALWPWLIDYASRVSTEATAVLLWTGGVWLFARGMRRGGAAVAGAAACFFALSLTRPEGLFVLLATAGALPVLCGWRERRAWRRFAAFAGLAALLVIANTFYVRALTGQTTANYRAGFIVEEFAYQRFVQTAVETFSDVIPVMLGPLLFLFLGVGFFQARDRARDPRLEATVLFFAAAQWGLSLFVLSPAPRYLMAPLIVLSMWSACGMHLAAGQIRAWRARPAWLARLPLVAVILFFLGHAAITVGSEHLGRRPREPREYKEAGLWMAANLTPGLIFTRKPQVGFYAGMPSTGPAPDDSLAEALDRARAAGAAYVVVDERYTAAMVPGLRPLLDPAAEHPGLRRLKTFESYPESRVVVYALAPAPDDR